MSHKSTILIVDDEPIGRQLIDAILYKEGYNLEFAENGREAFEKAKSVNPDLILMDVMMPEIDGFEVCQMLRADESMVNVPIILVTALDDIDSRIRGLEAGADDYISKPFDRLELLARIKIITRLNKYRKAEPAGEQQIANVGTFSSKLPELISISTKALNALNDDIGEIFPHAFVINEFDNKKNNPIYHYKKEGSYKSFSLCGGKSAPEETLISLYLSDTLAKVKPGQTTDKLNKALGAFKPDMFPAVTSINPYCLTIAYDESSNKLSFSGINSHLYFVRNGEMEVIHGSVFDLKEINTGPVEEKMIEINPGNIAILSSGNLQNMELDHQFFTDHLKKIMAENHGAEGLKMKMLQFIQDRSEIEKLAGNIVIAVIPF